MNTQHTLACHGRSKCENTIAALKRMLASEQGALVATQVKYDKLLAAITVWADNPTTGNEFAMKEAAAIAKAGGSE